MKASRKLILVAALLAPAAALARSAPIVTIENIAISMNADGKPHTLEQVKKAVVQAASTRNWTSSVRNPSTVRATYTKGKHSAVVDIVFTETTYSIQYVDSNELGYTDQGGKTVIHPSYNKAVNVLRQAIDAQLRTQ